MHAQVRAYRVILFLLNTNNIFNTYIHTKDNFLNEISHLADPGMY